MMMSVEIDCRFNDRVLYCANKKVKKKYFGFGPRKCVLMEYNAKSCPHREAKPILMTDPSPDHKVKEPIYARSVRSFEKS